MRNVGRKDSIAGSSDADPGLAQTMANLRFPLLDGLKDTLSPGQQLLSLAIGLFLAVCSGWAAATPPSLPVEVSILPQKLFVTMIGGDRVSVSVLVPPGYEPADYSPSPSQMHALATARIYFAIGVPFEDAWLPKIRAINPRLEIVPTQDGIQKMPMDTGGRISPGKPRLLDPHIWLSPSLVRIQGMNIRDALIRADPQHAAIYRLNYLRFARYVNSVDEKILSILAAHRGRTRTFMVFHPAWGYFARDYGLRQLPIEIEGKDPAPRDLVRLIHEAKRLGIKTVFVEPQFSKHAATAIATAIGGQVVAVDPLAENWGANLVAAAEALLSGSR